MKLLGKIVLTAAVAGGAAATMHAAPAGATLSVDAMTAKTANIRSESELEYRHVLGLKRIANKEKDVIKLNCVNDKLVQLKAEMNILDRLQTDLVTTSGAGDPNATFAEVVSTGNSIKALREEADQCIGEAVLASESSNDYTHPQIEDLPTSDPWGGTIEPPAYASPVN